jgi:hypothetical protein
LTGRKIGPSLISAALSQVASVRTGQVAGLEP